jgi:hypothetical protein
MSTDNHKRFCIPRLKPLFVAILILLVMPNLGDSITAGRATVSSDVDIVVDGAIGPPAAFGLSRLREALHARGVTLNDKKSLQKARTPTAILIGTLEGSSLIKDLKQSGELDLSDQSESLAVQHIDHDGGELFVAAGADDRGLMYALLDIARRIELSQDQGSASPFDFDSIPDTSESPRVPVRSMALFLHSQDNEREWYYSKEYWEDYFGMLAASRWNAFNLVFSHQTPYLAPMYPFHVEIDAFPEVKVKGLSDEQREKNLEMLRFITSLAQQRGLNFTLSVWQQIAWGVGTHTRTQESMVSGYNEENMTEYTYLALKKLLRECPGITGLQLRLNYKSGVTYEDQPAFFREAVFRAAREAGRPIQIEVRDIGLLRETLDSALATGLPVRVSHKYWGEHMVFPYHPTRFIWTYTYGDWLKYPREADQIYQVWSLGSHRVLQWGDPEFVRRFAETTTFQDAVGFEMCTPLAQKGFGNALGAWRIFRDKGREYYTWEFERYWSFFALLGRLTYNPQSGDEFWMREIENRFGREAAPAIAEAYRSASRVLPFIAGQAIDNYNMGAWPEKDMGGLINYYLNLKPYDRARFTGFREHVENVLAGRTSGKLTPPEVAARLEALAASTESALDRAKAVFQSSTQSLLQASSKEFWATNMDFRILSGMARYFAHKIRAATGLGFYYRTGDIGQLRQAIRSGEKALAAWKELSARADEIYSDNLVFGPGSVGHWKDNIRFVEHDLKQLKYQEEIYRITQHADFAFDLGPEPFTSTTSRWSTTYTNDFTIEPRFRGVFPSSRYAPQSGYGWIESQDLDAPETERIPRYTWSGARIEEEGLPGNALLGDYIQGTGDAVFRIDLPEGHYQVTVFATDRSPDPTDHGPMSITVVERFGDRPILKSEALRAGQTVIKRFNINMIGERFVNFRIRFSADPGADFIVNALMFTRVEPHIDHVPVRKANPDQDINISASVSLPPAPNDEYPLTSLGIITSNASTLAIPDDIVRVTLKYSTETANEFRSLDMRPSASGPPVYGASILAGVVKSGEIRYYLEAEDSTGHQVRLPSADAADPYFRIDVTRDRTAPAVRHSAITQQSPGQPLLIKAMVADESGISKVLLYYRPTRQTMEYSVVMMDGHGDEYTATIPGSMITKAYDIMYYIEAFDKHGNACLYPDPEVAQPYLVVKVERE